MSSARCPLSSCRQLRRPRRRPPRPMCAPARFDHLRREGHLCFFGSPSQPMGRGSSLPHSSRFKRPLSVVRRHPAPVSSPPTLFVFQRARCLSPGPFINRAPTTNNMTCSRSRRGGAVSGRVPETRSISPSSSSYRSRLTTYEQAGPYRGRGGRVLICLTQSKRDQTSLPSRALPLREPTCRVGPRSPIRIG